MLYFIIQRSSNKEPRIFGLFDFFTSSLFGASTNRTSHKRGQIFMLFIVNRKCVFWGSYGVKTPNFWVNPQNGFVVSFWSIKICQIHWQNLIVNKLIPKLRTCDFPKCTNERRECNRQIWFYFVTNICRDKAANLRSLTHIWTHEDTPKLRYLNGRIMQKYW